MHRTRLCLVVLSLVIAGARTGAAGVVTDPALETEVVVDTLSMPTTMAFYGPGDFLVLEKRTGLVRNVVDGVLQPGNVLDLAVEGAGERGLLGIAIHPDYPGTVSGTEHPVYLFYVPSSTDADTVGVTPLNARVDRFNFSNGMLTNPQNVLTIAANPAVEVHHGGVMAFSPIDKKLYVIVGDRSANGGLQNQGDVEVTNDTSVIFRVNADGTSPSDNPFEAIPGQDTSKYYAYGIRNAFGLAFDPETGSLWDTENGPESYDELNRVIRGFNSGWVDLMGPDSRDSSNTGDLTMLEGAVYSDPEFSWNEIVAPTGLAFLGGSNLGAAYQDSLVVANFSDRSIQRFQLNGAHTAIVSPHSSLNDLVQDSGDNVSGLDFGSDFGGITDLKVGPDGFLYGVSFGLGQVFVIRPSGASSDTHDLALVKMKAPKRVKISEKRPLVSTKTKLQIQNRSPQDETIVDLAMLEAFVSLDVVALGETGCTTAGVAIDPPKRFPIVLKPKKKLSVTFLVRFDCADTYGYSATLAHTALDDTPDTHPVDDVCPRPPLPFGVDPNPDGKVKDKGCGAKISGGDLGGPVQTEVIQK